MDRHPHPQWTEIAPVVSSQCDLRSDGSGDGLRDRRERGLNRVTNRLEEDTVLRRDRLSEECKVALDSSLHRLLVGLPALGAAFDVREEERDGFAGILGHGRLRRCCAVASVATMLVSTQCEV